MSKWLISVFIFTSLLSAETTQLIRNISVVHPRPAKTIKNAFVVIRNDRVVEIGMGQPSKLPLGTQVIDGKGGFLGPGLIDNHVHLLSVPGMNFQQQKKYAPLVEAYERQLPRSYLYFGYTTLVDVAVIDPKKIEKFRQSPQAPDLIHCGPPMPLANGYPMHYIEAPERFKVFSNFLYDPRQKKQIPYTIDPKQHTPRANINRVLAAGGRCVKTHFEQGFDASNLPTPTPKMLKAIATETRRAGLPLLMHANSWSAQSRAIVAPPDIFVHGMWNWGIHAKKEGLPTPIRKTLDQIIEKKIGYSPTYQVIAGLRSLYDPAFLDSPTIKKVVPKELIAWYRTKEAKWFGDMLLKRVGITAKIIQKRHTEILNRLDRTVLYMAANKGRLLFGTDTPSGPLYTNLPGWNGYLEMKRWALAGLSLKTILAAATIDNAEAFGMEKDYGTVAKGKFANLVLYSKNPLETVEAYNSLSGVFIRGKYFPREVFSADQTTGNSLAE